MKLFARNERGAGAEEGRTTRKRAINECAKERKRASRGRLEYQLPKNSPKDPLPILYVCVFVCVFAGSQVRTRTIKGLFVCCQNSAGERKWERVDTLTREQDKRNTTRVRKKKENSTDWGWCWLNVLKRRWGRGRKGKTWSDWVCQRAAFLFLWGGLGGMIMTSSGGTRDAALEQIKDTRTDTGRQFYSCPSARERRGRFERLSSSSEE